MVGDNPGVGAAAVGMILGNGVPVDAGVGVGIGGSVESSAPIALGVDAGADVRAGAAAAYTGSSVGGIGVCVRVNVGRAVGAMVGVGIVVGAVVWGTSGGGVGTRANVGRVVGITGGVGLGRSSGEFTPCQRRVATSRIDTAVPTADVVKLRPIGRHGTCVGAEGQNWSSGRGHSTTTTPMVVSLPSSTRDSM